MVTIKLQRIWRINNRIMLIVRYSVGYLCPARVTAECSCIFSRLLWYPLLFDSPVVILLKGMRSSTSERLQGFALGAVSAVVVIALANFVSGLIFRKEKSKLIIAEDECMSLFYDNLPREKKGSGFAELNTTSEDTVARLKTVHPEYAKIPEKQYKLIVESVPIVCIDVICRRQDGGILLFYRRDKPAANIWWWPGGRIYRGETFYDAAVRKIRDETGCKSAQITPKGVVGVWNTFFPDSHWDAERKPGREGTQTINVVVMCDIEWDTTALLNAVSSNSAAEWAVEAHRWITVDEALAIGKYDKYISGNIKLAQSMKLL
jgi:ADP-ribose pyrophosphatase YjhB (NUDIX family)